MQDRRIARQAAMCLLYEKEIRGDDPEGTLEHMADVLRTEEITNEMQSYIDSVLRNFDKEGGNIDLTIERYCHSYKLSRISKVDLSILRLAIIEITYLDIPFKVSINEAVDMAKKFSADKSAKFVNGVLASFVKDKGSGQTVLGD